MSSSNTAEFAMLPLMEEFNENGLTERGLEILLNEFNKEFYRIDRVQKEVNKSKNNDLLIVKKCLLSRSLVANR